MLALVMCPSIVRSGDLGGNMQRWPAGLAGVVFAQLNLGSTDAGFPIPGTSTKRGPRKAFVTKAYLGST